MSAIDFKTYYTDAKVAVLKAAFDKVAPMDHWKNPINVVVDVKGIDDVELISEAITFYTGSVARTETLGVTRRGITVRFRAAGYFATIGA